MKEMLSGMGAFFVLMSVAGDFVWLIFFWLARKG